MYDVHSTTILGDGKFLYVKLMHRSYCLSENVKLFLAPISKRCDRSRFAYHFPWNGPYQVLKPTLPIGRSPVFWRILHLQRSIEFRRNDR